MPELDEIYSEGILFKTLVKIHTLNMLSNKFFTVYIREENSKINMLNNGLSQGSVLALLLFNFYIKDLLRTNARKCIYTGNLTLAFQSKDFKSLENALFGDLDILHKYYK